MTRHTQDLDRLAELFRLPGEIVERFGKLYADDPDAARDLLRKLQSAVGDDPRGGNGRSARRNGGPSNLDIVTEHFRSNGNAWQTKRQIMEATGLTEGQIHATIYGTGKGLFESERNLIGKEAGFRLAERVTAFGVSEDIDDSALE